MKIQLTKDKTIDIDLSKLGGGRSAKSDIVGVELFSGHSSGAPAVHIYRKRNEWRLAAASKIAPPDGELPREWSETPHQPRWALPHGFHAPSAAIAVNSDMGVFGQSSPEAVIRDMVNGVAASPAAAAPSRPDSGKKRLGIAKRQPSPAVAAESNDSKAKPQFPGTEKPVSYNGRRFAVKPFAEDGFYLSASLPEFQALWLSRLLPEGRRPTASSIQLAPSALMASVLAQPEYVERKGSMLAVFVKADSVFFAGYKEGMPLLWRQCPGAGGYNAMRAAVKKTLGVDEDLVTEVLEESLVDPRPAVEPFLHPILDQLELAQAYLSGNHGIATDRTLLLGLPHGAELWRTLAAEILHTELVPANPFGGIAFDKGVEVDSPEDYLVALGAALAASEVES